MPPFRYVCTHAIVYICVCMELHMCAHRVSFPTIRSGGFQSSSHQKTLSDQTFCFVFFLQVDNGMISKSLVYQKRLLKNSQQC